MTDATWCHFILQGALIAKITNGIMQTLLQKLHEGPPQLQVSNKN